MSRPQQDSPGRRKTPRTPTPHQDPKARRNQAAESDISVLDVLGPKQKKSRKKSKTLKPRVAVIMGSLSDRTVMEAATKILERFDVPFLYEVISAHRTPSRVKEFASNARDDGLKVVIAGAGGAAHLPGMVAAHTTVPVIGVPVPTKYLGGLDSLYSIVQMPAGVPVATVSIGGAENAALLALQILSNSDKSIANKLTYFRDKLEERVEIMNEELNSRRSIEAGVDK